MKSLPSLIALSLISTLTAATKPQTTPTPSQQQQQQQQMQQPPSSPHCWKTDPFCSDVTYELYGDLLYLQPNASNLYYAVEAIPFDEDIAIPAASPNWKVFEINPNYRFGFDVGLQVLFPNSQMNIEANWERLHTHDSHSHHVPISGDMVGPIFDIGPNSALYLKAKGKARFHFDTANLMFVKRYCFYDRIYTSFYAGASFVRIKEILRAEYSNTSTSTARIIESHSTFTGGGPQFGLNFDCRLYDNLFFTGSSSVSLYMGRLDNSTTFRSFSPGLTHAGIPQPNKQRTSVPHRTQVVPGFEEKLGFSYAILFNNCCKLEFGIGYQLQIYLDAIQSIDMTAPQVLPSLVPGVTVDLGVYAVGFERTLSNFMLTGPYFSTSFDF